MEIKMLDIKTTIAEMFAKTDDAVKTTVIETLYNAELEKRTAACLKVIEELATIEKEYKKKLNNPDQTTHDEFGKVVGATFSKEAANELRKLRDRQTTLENALIAGLEKNDFVQLLNLNK